MQARAAFTGGNQTARSSRNTPQNATTAAEMPIAGAYPLTALLDPQRGYDRLVIEDPLKSALEEIAPKLDPGLDPLAAALLAEEPVEDAWAGLLQEILDAA